MVDLCIYGHIYVENGSKNHPGTFGHNEQSNKVVPMYSNRSAVPRCAVHLLDLYFSKCPQPPNALSFFYLKPLPKKPVESTLVSEYSNREEYASQVFQDDVQRCWYQGEKN